MRTLFTAALLGATLLGAAAAQAQDHPLDGVWEGAYICDQGKTGLTLTLDATPGGQVTGEFAFWPRSDNPGVPPGRFTIRGTVSPSGDLTLNGDRWLRQPSGYQTINLTGKARRGAPGQPDVLLGRVIGPNCTDWVVQRK